LYLHTTLLASFCVHSASAYCLDFFPKCDS
jgi:hypothetical protein